MNSLDSLQKLEKIAALLRSKVIEMSHLGRAAHLGSSLSCIDILVAFYWKTLKCNPQKPNDPLRDRLILSKGHAATALYAALAFKGYFPIELLQLFCKEGSPLAEHPGPGSVPGIEAATGSLGHGLPIGLGIALAGKISQQKFQVNIVMSDGECNEGSIWEAAMFAAANALNNVTVVIDFNKWQATGRSNEVMALEPLRDKWKAFGWETFEINGHNLDELITTIEQAKEEKQKPTAIIAHTIKGKGISFMEDDNNWHYRIPNPEEILQANKELGTLSP